MDDANLVFSLPSQRIFAKILSNGIITKKENAKRMIFKDLVILAKNTRENLRRQTTKKMVIFEACEK